MKFSAVGSTIVIRLASSPAGLDISVADRGRGISAEFLPHIFERFRQEDSSTRRWHGGLGLGLAIVKHLVDAHGGSVTAESGGPNMGATFAVHIPTSSERRAAPRTAPDEQLHELAGVRVLVVEDDSDARALVSQMFREAHANVRDVADVRSALASLDAFAPQLVVSDVGMPDQDGYDLIRQIREGGRDAATLPAIALTAFARDEDSAKAMRAGYQRHIGKPVDANLLLRTAAELIHRA